MGKVIRKASKAFSNHTSANWPQSSSPTQGRLTVGDCIIEATKNDLIINTPNGTKYSLSEMMERLEQLETRYMEDVMLGGDNGSSSYTKPELKKRMEKKPGAIRRYINSLFTKT